MFNLSKIAVRCVLSASELQGFTPTTSFQKLLLSGQGGFNLSKIAFRDVFSASELQGYHAPLISTELAPRSPKACVGEWNKNLSFGLEH